MFQGYHCELGVSSFKRRIPLNYAYGSFNGKWNMILNAGDVVSLTLPSTLSSLDTPCHLYGLYNACAANPKVLQKYLLNWNRWDSWNFAGWDKMKMVWLIILIDWYDLFIVLIDCYDLFIVWLMSWLMVWWCGSSGKWLIDSWLIKYSIDWVDWFIDLYMNSVVGVDHLENAWETLKPFPVLATFSLQVRFEQLGYTSPDVQ